MTRVTKLLSKFKTSVFRPSLSSRFPPAVLLLILPFSLAPPFTHFSGETQPTIVATTSIGFLVVEFLPALLSFPTSLSGAALRIKGLLPKSYFRRGNEASLSSPNESNSCNY
jgi:hypothetical protein